jgi:hypothetical protein
MAKNGNTIDNMFKDGSSNSVQIGSSFKTSDATASPLTSPATLTGSVQTITIPDNAVEFIVNPTTNSLKVSELSNLTYYDVVAKGTKESIPCAKMQYIYIQGTASDTLNFRFTLI